MKRATKILTLILIVVFVFTVFASCDLIGKDVAKYRATTAMKVGNEEISIGKLLDTFNSYYNNYYYYIAYGYMTVDDLLQMVVSALIQQYSQIDDYVTRNTPITPELASKARHAEYLTAEEFEYCILYVRYVSFTTFDESVEKNISGKYELGDLEEEDTSRDFTKPDELWSETSYAEHVYKQNFVNKDANEYFEKYYADVDFDGVDIESYVYASEEQAQARLDEYNERIEDEDKELTFEEFADIQQKVLKQYSDTISYNYGITLGDFLQGQINDMVSSSILAKWSYEAYDDLDNDADVKELLTRRFGIYKDAQIADYNLKDNFDSFITSLSSSSYIYDTNGHGQDYVFVKNILVPFTTAQSNKLSALANSLGDTSRPEYIALRNQLATEILAEYFDSDKYDPDFEALFGEFLVETETDDDEEEPESKYEKIGGIFTTNNGSLDINPDGALGQFFNTTDKTVNEVNGLSSAEVIIELMKRFNTDVGQHTAQYDYVVYVGDDWKDYDHAWVEEFYTAVNELRDGDTFNGVGKYAMCVSTYGVHIIYVDSYVEDKVFTLDIDEDYDDRLDTTSDFYRWFTKTFQDEVTERTNDKYEALVTKYLNEGKISITKEFDKFMEENEFTFDFDLFIQELKDEHNN